MKSSEPCILCAAAMAATLALSGVDAFAPPAVARSLPTSPESRRSSSSSLCMAGSPKGCAAKPYEKKKIAVFGAGGYLGAVVFGFLQRAGSIYGTGIAAGQSPRALCSTSAGAGALNKFLASRFKLAYAGEGLIRLVDTTDVEHIAERVRGFDAAILGTAYQLESRPITRDTYEKKPGDKTFEIYLDENYGAEEKDRPGDDSEIHTSIFRNSVRACVSVGMGHFVVVESPRTKNSGEFVNILEEEGASYTYIRATSALKKDVNYTYEKGISNVLSVVRLPAGLEVLIPYDLDVGGGDESLSISREDVAALAVQSLMTLDWEENRIIEISSSPGKDVSSGYGGKMKQGLRFDRDWCPNSDLLAEVLQNL